jgi:acetolactate decarboxylase
MSRSRATLLLLLALAGAGCPSRPAAPRAGTAPANGITQVATIDALLAGVYDGHMSLEDLGRHGDFGIGTFEALDGEMVLLDGRFHQVRADGRVYSPPLSARTPFAAVTHFRADHEERLAAGVDRATLEARVDALVPGANRICAFLVRGRFRRVKVRSVPRQAEPYPPLAEVTKTQPVFTLAGVEGRLVGFRLPAFVKGVNVPGFHVHFLADDLSSGGHVLELGLETGTLLLDSSHDFLDIRLPAPGSAFDGVDLAPDRSRELDRVEKDTGGPW